VKAVEINNISKIYGEFPALDSVSFNIEENDICYIYGKNGARKTTLLEVIAGLKKQTSGSLKIFGQENDSQINSLSAVFVDSFLYGDLTVNENLNLYGKLYNVKDLESKIESLFAKFSLKDKRDSFVKHLSSGLEKRAAISRALLTDPKVLILDEPATGLDYESKKEVISAIREAGKEKTILLSSHDLETAKSVANNMAFLESGKLKYFGQIDKGFEMIS